MNIAVPLSKNYGLFCRKFHNGGAKRTVGESVVFEQT